MLSPGMKVFYFFVLSAIPLLLWIIPESKVHIITFFAICVFYLISRYWKTISFFQEAIEIIFLYLALFYLLEQIGVSKYFPADSVLIIIAMYFFLLLLKKQNRQKLYLVKGNIKSIFGAIIIFSFLSIVSLTVWFIFHKGNPYAKFIPDLPTPILILLGIGFAIINGFYEEGLFRSILLTRFSEQIGLGWAVLLQSIWFSFLHYQSGFPSGIIGIGLTFIFGLMMGYLVYRSKGLIVPIVIHALADFSIFLLVVLRMQNII